MDFPGRLQRLRADLGASGQDALLVTALANVRYLTGFSGSAGMLLVTGEDTVLLTDGRYDHQARDELHAAGVDARVEIGGPGAQQDAVAVALGGARRLALESTSITWSRQRALAEALGSVELVPTIGIVEKLRRVKDPGEVSRIEAAARIADEALSRVRPSLADQPTERAFAAALDLEMRLLGASSSSFETIVASGPNAAMPHARPTDRVIRKGELVVVDFGAVVDGYCSDMTRTLCDGSPGRGLGQEILAVVRASQAAGVEAVRAGVPAASVDRACRDVIESAGWGGAFVHGTGHGVGLEIHEAPSLGAKSPDMLEAGSVVTIEPGVYLPGEVGARIEDAVVVTEAGCRVLTNSPKELATV